MADSKISDLSAATALAATDLFVIAQEDTATKKLTAAVLPGFELDYAQVTSDVSVTATAEATPNDAVALPARVYDGSTVIILEFFCAGVNTGATASSEVLINLWDDATDLGRWGEQFGASQINPVLLRRRLTPSAASHTYKARAWRVASNGILKCTSPYLPMFIRSCRA